MQFCGLMSQGGEHKWSWEAAAEPVHGNGL